jgi:hypothetical protein
LSQIELNRASWAPPFRRANHRAQIKIPGFSQTMLPHAAHLLAETGYFYSAWFSLGNDPKKFPRWSWAL